MSCIGWDRSLDTFLHDLYAEKLLEPGWAGEVDDVEAAYIARKLCRSPALRRQWQVSRFTRYRKQITPTVVKRLARMWAEMPALDIEASVTDMVLHKNRSNTMEDTNFRAKCCEPKLSLGRSIRY